MDGLFKKTMSYLNAEGVTQDEFVGKIVEVATIKLKILRRIAEGKFEDIFQFLCCYLLWKIPRHFVQKMITNVGGS